jgi:amidase
MSTNRWFARTRLSSLVLLAFCTTIPCAHEAIALGNQTTGMTTRTSSVDVSGDWEFSAKILNDFNYGRLILKVDGANVSGTLSLAGWGQNKVDGSIKGNVVSLRALRPSGHLFGEFAGTTDDGILQGTGSWPSFGSVTWSARRAAQRPSTPQVHDFEPKEFHRVFSDAIPPVLRVFPRDTVRTWTVDAGGVDSKGVRRSLGGNPQTGPFYVEGAMPGDTLVVRLTRVRLNRDSAGSGSRVAGTALRPRYIQVTQYDDNFDSNWSLDRVNGIGRLAKPSAHLKNYTVTLQPMIGCIAVAPDAHQSFATGYPGSFGGNMDYNQIREGTTVYLPVSAPGALLFIGDGHAAQGDGELTGSALETSMDVEFSVDLIKGFTTFFPRFENDEYLMSAGIGPSLSDALQHGTTQLLTWLQHEYKLTPNEAAIVLGTALRYDIAEVVDPQMHIVAKIRKDVVGQLK